MIALRAWLQWIGPLPIDRFAISRFGPRGVPHWILSLCSGTDFALIVGATMLIGTIGLLCLIGRSAAIGFTMSALVIVWNALIKMAFGPVPFWAHGRAGVNYPSGHMSWTAATFGYLAWIALDRRNYWQIGPCVAVILAVAVERVMSGAHTISDLIGGFLLAMTWIVIVISYVYAASATYQPLGLRFGRLMRQ
jgi:membrane-associated phospholipid phosphatase